MVIKDPLVNIGSVGDLDTIDGAADSFILGVCREFCGSRAVLPDQVGINPVDRRVFNSTYR